MEIFLEYVGFLVCISAVVFAVLGIVGGIVSLYEYFVDLKATVSRIENLIKAEDYTGAEDARNGS